jgi:large subunit ribosomal protein L4
MKAQVYDTTGTKKQEVDLSAALFEAKVNPTLIAQAIRVYLANQRQGNANTKTRSEVTGSTRKIYKQKGTGNARHGDIKAPVFVGGGIVHGPVTHSFTLTMPKKMKNAALKSALSTKAADVAVVEGMAKIEGKTKSVNSLVKSVKGTKKRPLIVLAEDMDGMLQGLRNVTAVDYVNAMDLNTYDVMNHDCLIFATEALEVLEKRVGK